MAFLVGFTNIQLTEFFSTPLSLQSLFPNVFNYLLEKKFSRLSHMIKQKTVTKSMIVCCWTWFLFCIFPTLKHYAHNWCYQNFPKVKMLIWLFIYFYYTLAYLFTCLYFTMSFSSILIKESLPFKVLIKYLLVNIMLS